MIERNDLPRKRVRGYNRATLRVKRQGSNAQLDINNDRLL